MSAKRKLATWALATMAAGWSMAAYAAPVKIRFTHQFPETHFIAQEVRHFAGLVEQKTGGEVVLEVFSAAQAYKPSEVIEAVVTGAIEAGMTTNMD